jgi:hypothetical protein
MCTCSTLDYQVHNATTPRMTSLKLTSLFALSFCLAATACADADTEPTHEAAEQQADDLTAAGLAKKLRAVQNATKAADIGPVTDFGRSFGYKKYPAGTLYKKMLADVTGSNEAEFHLSAFEQTSGAKAITSLAGDIYGEAKDLATDSDSKVAADALKTVARSLYGLKSVAPQFTSVKLFSHAIAEDGDLQSDTLVLTQRDGSFIVVSYTNFPF